MPTIRFTDNIQRHIEYPAQEVAGDTVRDAVEAYFASNERARGYVLDDQGVLRRHMVIFVDGRQIADRNSLSDRVNKHSTIDVMQALSGG